MFVSGAITSLDFLASVFEKQQVLYDFFSPFDRSRGGVLASLFP